LRSHTPGVDFGLSTRGFPKTVSQNELGVLSWGTQSLPRLLRTEVNVGSNPNLRVKVCAGCRGFRFLLLACTLTSQVLLTAVHEVIQALVKSNHIRTSQYKHRQKTSIFNRKCLNKYKKVQKKELLYVLVY